MDLGRFGRAVRALRRRRRWRQEDLAGAAGVSRSQVGRLERGESRALTLETVDRVAGAVGASADLLLRWQGEGLDRLLDEEHARMVEAVVRRLRALGWDVAVEVSFSRFGERGSIDVLAWHPEHRALAVFEVKSVTPDMQAMLVGLDRKARLGPVIARERGWEPEVVAKVLVIGDTRTNRRRLEAHAATVAAALPAGTRQVQRWLADPGRNGLAGVWFLANGRAAAGSPRARQRVRARRSAPSSGGDRQTGGGPPDGPSSRPF
jgi:transcriptional regulator with XRE-family HTH domain